MSKLIIDNSCGDREIMKIMALPGGRYISRIECRVYFTDHNHHPDDEPDYRLDSVDVESIAYESFDEEANDYREIEYGGWPSSIGMCERKFRELMKAMAEWFVWDFQEDIDALDAFLNGRS